MSYKIIVTRFNENIDWLKDEMKNCVICNKGKPFNISNEILLENVGRESESNLRYIIENYHHLPDVLVFTQANIADHIGCNDVRYLLYLKDEALQFSKSHNFLIHYDAGGNNINWDKEWNLRNGKFYLENNYKNGEPFTFIEWYKKNIDINYPEPIFIYRGAIFAVRKDCIMNKPVEYYKKLLLEVNHHNDPAEGHFFERSWFYIFK